MSVISKTILKTYFETGDKPTQAQFIDLIDTVIDHNLATAQNTFLVASGAGDFAENTAAQVAEILKAYITDSTIQTLVDGASITVDHDSWGGRIFSLSTAQATPTMNVSNFGKGGHISVKKTISGDTVITIQGTGYKFVNMDTKALPAASVDITLSDTINFGFEINLMNAGYTSGGDAVINVKKG